MVSESPKSGSEIMDMMEGNLQGWWRPSPGSIYPMLRGMEEEGVLSKSKGKKYSLTEKGREEIEHPFPWMGRPMSSPRSVERVLDEISSDISYLEDVGESSGDRLTGSVKKIKDLGDRLTKLGGSR